jgi:hypothetical protein
MEFEKKQEQEQEVTQTSQGVQHKRVEEEEPKEPEQAELPKEEKPEEEEVITDLLGSPVAPQKPAPKPKPKAPVQKKVEAKPKEEKKYGTDYTVCYARYREVLPKEDMTLEDIREWLEADYPELSKERTKMDVDEKTKTIAPIPSNAKKG